jgi:DNA processing protein
VPAPEELREARALLRLKTRVQGGEGRLRDLVEAAGSGLEALRRIGVQGELLPPSSSDPPLARWVEAGYGILPMTSPRYPGALWELPDPPPVLFLRGRWELLHGPAVAIVGSRKATETGRRSAETMARILGAAGICVVSGLALGIDGAAHRGALAGGGPTVAVLGSGLDVGYPAAHRPLREKIARQGALLSEFLPGEEARKYHFPKRNRIIAALARAVIVVEAGARSGALITVDHALDLGREVLVTPGSVENPQAVGSNGLLRDGARPLTDPAGIMEELEPMGFQLPPAQGEPLPAAGIPLELKPLWEALSTEPRELDQVARSASLPMDRALAGLSTLELNGWVRQCPGMRFMRR